MEEYKRWVPALLYATVPTWGFSGWGGVPAATPRPTPPLSTGKPHEASSTAGEQDSQAQGMKGWRAQPERPALLVGWSLRFQVEKKVAECFVTKFENIEQKCKCPFLQMWEIWDKILKYWGQVGENQMEFQRCRNTEIQSQSIRSIRHGPNRALFFRDIACTSSPFQEVQSS